ncbi:MAG: vitamin K epoxide reductase family protein [Candidatus Neomarinimicrobiota bacterium]
MELRADLVLAILLSISGGLVSLYFLKVYRRQISLRPWWIPRPVQMTGATCVRIVDSRYGRVFRQPNAYWGLWYYSGLSGLILIKQVTDFPDARVLAVITGAALVLSLYLLHGLYVLKVICRPCLTTHAINFGLFLIFFLRLQ